MKPSKHVRPTTEITNPLLFRRNGKWEYGQWENRKTHQLLIVFLHIYVYLLPLHPLQSQNNQWMLASELKKLKCSTQTCTEWRRWHKMTYNAKVSGISQSIRRGKQKLDKEMVHTQFNMKNTSHLEEGCEVPSMFLQSHSEDFRSFSKNIIFSKCFFNFTSILWSWRCKKWIHETGRCDSFLWSIHLVINKVSHILFISLSW